jgi:streptogrisin C
VLVLSGLLATSVGVGEPVRASAAESGPVSLASSPGVGEKVARSSPKMLEAIQRDLRLSRAEAITRIGRQHAAGAVEAKARVAVGGAFAGSWLNGDGSALMVAVTDQRAVSAVRAAGATPVLVAYRRGELEAARLKLGDHFEKAPSAAVHGWHVDPRRNRLVVSVAAGKHSDAAAWVAAAAVPAKLVAYDTSAGPIRLTADYFAGDGFRGPDGGCTAGFGVEPPRLIAITNGFVTAGHCAPRTSTLTLNQPIPLLADASVVKSTFPVPTTPARIHDHAVAQLNSPNPQIRPLVKMDDLTGIPVLGSQAALIGQMVCRYGNITKFQCGTLVDTGRTATDSTEFPGITFIGLNVMTGCVQRGDSGGPVITEAGQAQGIISGTTCLVPGPLLPETFYQPINKTLSDFQLRLLKASGSPIEPPRIAALSCYVVDDYYPTIFYCDLYWNGGTDPDEVQISSNGSQARRFNDYDQNYVSISGYCDRYQDTYVSISVFDAEGRRADAGESGFCPRF